MINLAYMHDHNYYLCRGKYYSAGTMSDMVFARFFGFSKNIKIFAYVTELPINADVSKMTEISDSRISFSALNSDLERGARLDERLLVRREILQALSSCDALVARIPGTLTCRYCSYLSRKKLIPIGLEVVGCTFDALWNHGSVKAKIVAIPSYLLMKRVVRDASHVVYVTSEFLQSRYPCEGSSTNASNVVITEAVAGDSGRVARLNRKGVILRLGIVGNWSVKYKGHRELLKALSTVEFRNYTLELVGGGDPKEIVALVNKCGLADKVKVVGRLKPGKEVVQWLDNIDVLIHPSKQEGLPRVVIEAMSRGCPVLASSVAGIPELLPPQRLHKPGDVEQLRRQLRTIMADPRVLSVDVLSNIRKSQEYMFPVLESRRVAFWKDFSEGVKGFQ